jgi:hypothetical protein
VKASLTLLMSLFPFWGAGIILVCAQLAIFYRRRKQQVWIGYVAAGAVIGLFILIWLIFRGDKNSPFWIDSLYRAFS